MVTKRVDGNNKMPRRRPPAATPEGREQQLTAMAYDLAERQLEEGTASAQVITHLLKAGSENAKLEREKLRYENLKKEAEIKRLEQGGRNEELYAEVLAALKIYSGSGDPEEGEYYE